MGDVPKFTSMKEILQYNFQDSKLNANNIVQDEQQQQQHTRGEMRLYIHIYHHHLHTVNG